MAAVDSVFRPAPLRPGDEVRVVAPARSRTLVLEPDRTALIEQRFADLGLKLSYGAHVDEIDDFTSSPITSRVADLHDAFADPAVRGILTVIGGFNSNELLPHLDWDLIARNPKTLCGYSDITALQNAILARTGLITYTGPHWSTFGMRDHFEQTLAWFRHAILGSDPYEIEPANFWTDDLWFLDQDNRTPEPTTGWWPLQPGTAQGRLLLTERLVPQLGQGFRVEIIGFGDRLDARTPEQLTATSRRSDLQAALAGLRERYRGRVVAGVVLLSDGGDTSETAERTAAEAGVAVYPIGIGAARLPGDREILSVTAAEAVLDDSRLDLGVTAIAHGGGTAPIELRLLENGRAIQVARVAAAADTPIHHVFRASPPRGAPTVYTVDTPVAAGDPVPENNTRSVLVQGPSRTRRILLVEGAPGFEHSFLKRALAGDQGLEIDAVVRKGKDEQGASTFYVQAARSRSAALVDGYPPTADALAVYDAIVLANVDAALLPGARLEATRDFVARRGGGLLVLGSASFATRGLTGTALEDALPLQLNGRDGGAVPASTAGGVNRVALTAEGAVHPIMQIADDVEATRTRWAAVPPLATVTLTGGPRPGASVLAVADGAGGGARALVAVQRYGLGRAMTFTGEASWRWRMQLPSSDRTYETFWRQAVRWLSLPAGDPIQLTVPAAATPGDSIPLRATIRTPGFDPIADAAVDVHVSRRRTDAWSSSRPAALPAPRTEWPRPRSAPPRPAFIAWRSRRGVARPCWAAHRRRCWLAASTSR